MSSGSVPVGCSLAVLGVWWVSPCVMVCPYVVVVSCMQREFEERRNAEYVEVQRLEEQERRRTQEKVCACVYVRSYYHPQHPPLHGL